MTKEQSLEEVLEAIEAFTTAFPPMIVPGGGVPAWRSVPTPKAPFIEAWEFLDKNIQRASPQWFVAGGALRDTICGFDVKDVDVFVPIGDKRCKLWKAANKGHVYLGYNKSINKVEFIPGPDPRFKGMAAGYQFKLTKTSDPAYEIGNFITYQCTDIPGLNVIFYYDKKWGYSSINVFEKIRTFPHNISRVAMYEGKLLTTPMFDDGVKNKEVVFDSGEGMIRYNARLQEKGYNAKNGWSWRGVEAKAF